MAFVGRKKELETLETLKGKKNASLVVINGRRRIGKSRLAEEFGRSFARVFFFSGLPPTRGMTPKHQREEFVRKMVEYGIPRLSGEDWADFFRDLARHSFKGRYLVVLDEISWMGMGDPSFLGKLKTAWDTEFKKNPHLILILSGSQSTWIEKNILNSSGFVGRISLQMTLEELSISECNEFWGPQKDHVSAHEKLKILAVTGGVPRYLEEIQPKHSAEDNIKRLCFSREGLLFHEFDRIFSDLFSKRSTKYKIIVQELAEGSRVTENIVKAFGRNKKGHAKGGDISACLEDLCKTGFVSRDFTWDIKTASVSKLSHYRLSDNYTRFYLKYVEPVKKRIEAGLGGLPTPWSAIMGLQFENLVLSPKNRGLVYDKLRLTPDEILWSNPFFQTRTGQRQGCQIDWMIQTRYNTLYLCEIKFNKDEIEADVINQVRQKMAAFKMPKNFSVRPVLIHVSGVSDSVIEAEFFSDIVDFRDFL